MSRCRCRGDFVKAVNPCARVVLLRRAHDRRARSVTFGSVALAHHLRLDLEIGRIAMIYVGAIVKEAKYRDRCQGAGTPVAVSGSEIWNTSGASNMKVGYLAA